MTEASSVSSDIPCRTCGYNLRSLDTQSLCPECATPVSLSLRSDLLCFADPHWVYTWCAGILITASGALITALAFMIVSRFASRSSFFLLNDPNRLASRFARGHVPIMIALALLLGIILRTIGAWIFTTPDPSRSGDPYLPDPERRIRQFIRLAALIAFFNSLLQFPATRLALPISTWNWINIFDSAASIFSAFGITTQLHYVQRLSRRIPSSSHIRAASILKWLLPAAYSLWFLAALFFWHILPISRTPAFIFTSLVDLTRICGILFSIAWLGYLVLLIQFRKSVQQTQSSFFLPSAA